MCDCRKHPAAPASPPGPPKNTRPQWFTGANYTVYSPSASSPPGQTVPVPSPSPSVSVSPSTRTISSRSRLTILLSQPAGSRFWLIQSSHQTPSSHALTTRHPAYSVSFPFLPVNTRLAWAPQCLNEKWDKTGKGKRNWESAPKKKKVLTTRIYRRATAAYTRIVKKI